MLLAHGCAWRKQECTKQGYRKCVETAATHGKICHTTPTRHICMCQNIAAQHHDDCVDSSAALNTSTHHARQQACEMLNMWHPSQHMAPAITAKATHARWQVTQCPLLHHTSTS